MACLGATALLRPLCVHYAQGMLNGPKTETVSHHLSSVAQWYAALGRRSKTAWVSLVRTWELAAMGLQMFFTQLSWGGRLRTYKFNRKQPSCCLLYRHLGPFPLKGSGGL